MYPAFMNKNSGGNADTSARWSSCNFAIAEDRHDRTIDYHWFGGDLGRILCIIS
jgi:hypothetical protein